MVKIRKLDDKEIRQAEALASALADCLSDVSEQQNINNVGVLSAAILVVIASILTEFLDSGERKTAATIFTEQLLMSVAELSDDASPNSVN